MPRQCPVLSTEFLTDCSKPSVLITSHKVKYGSVHIFGFFHEAVSARALMGLRGWVRHSGCIWLDGTLGNRSRVAGRFLWMPSNFLRPVHHLLQRLQPEPARACAIHPPPELGKEIRAFGEKYTNRVCNGARGLLLVFKLGIIPVYRSATL